MLIEIFVVETRILQSGLSEYFHGWIDEPGREKHLDESNFKAE